MVTLGKGAKIPMEYKTLRTSWMTAAIIEQWVRSLDRIMAIIGRKFALSADY